MVDQLARAGETVEKHGYRHSAAVQSNTTLFVPLAGATAKVTVMFVVSTADTYPPTAAAVFGVRLVHVGAAPPASDMPCAMLNVVCAPVPENVADPRVVLT